MSLGGNHGFLGDQVRVPYILSVHGQHETSLNVVPTISVIAEHTRAS